MQIKYTCKSHVWSLGNKVHNRTTLDIILSLKQTLPNKFSSVLKYYNYLTLVRHSKYFTQTNTYQIYDNGKT